MEAKQIKQELQQVEQVIGRALQAIKSDGAVPQDLRDCVQELDRQSKKAKQSQSQSELEKCVEDLEAASDRARDAAERAGDLGSSAKAAVLQAHDQLSNLKHQLH
jgi:hypothetical protein